MIFWLASYPKSGNTWVRMFWRSYFLPSNQVFSLNKRGNLDLEVFNFPTANQLKEANVDHTDFRNIAKNWITLQDIINLNNKLNLGVCADWFVGPRVEAGWLSANDLFKKINK